MEHKGLILRVYGEKNHELNLDDTTKVCYFVSTRSPLCGVDDKALAAFAVSCMHVAGRDYGERVVDFRYTEKVNYENILRLAKTINSELNLRCIAEVLFPESAQKTE